MAAGDDLNGPLGLGDGPHRLSPRTLPYRRIFFAVVGLSLLGGGLLLEFNGDPFGGEPYAVATITRPMPSQAAHHASRAAIAGNKGPAVSNETTGTIAVPPGDDSAQELERKSGVKVVRNGAAGAPGALIINVPQVLARRLAPAPDPRLAEKSRYGLLPRIGPDGARPADVYARPWPVGALPNPKAPRIALVVGGVGLNDSATAEAISDLPGPVTLAFAPYGTDLPGQVRQAREAGHEVILQLPMEPIDYPHDNPGPHTLLAEASATKNTDNLHWLLSRFSGYTGVANFLGGKFMSAADRFRPVLRELANRGLFYFDDGSSPRSLGLSLAKDVGLPAAQADLIIDATGDLNAIDANLTQLVTIARAKGIAIGMASDLPTSLEKIAAFTKRAKAQGVLFIPLSAAVRNLTNVAETDARAFHDRVTPQE
ncbi:MAG: divergent polysaccharide deacetylase family protein [Methylovirgula sp.]